MRFTVSGDLLVAFTIEVEADTEEEAEEKVGKMDWNRIERHGNVDTEAGIRIDGTHPA